MAALLDGAIGIYFLYGGALLGLAVGLIYYAWSNSTDGPVIRLLCSAFGPSIALVFVAAILWPDQHRYRPASSHAFLALQLLPMSLLVLTLAKFSGPRKAHYFLVPLGLLAWAWTFVWGWSFVNGK